MTIGPDDHGCFLDLFQVVRLDNIYGIEAAQSSKALLPSYTWALTLNFGRDGSGQLLEVLGIPERFRGKPAQNHIGCL